MLILGIESATNRAGCAVGDRSGVLAAVQATRSRRHAEQLAPQIQTACAQSGVTLQDVEAVAVDVGPGLYTGLRVGVTTAITVAHALQVPMIACVSLDIVAFALRCTRRRIAAVIDARRKEVFWAAYRPTGEGVQRLSNPAVASARQAAAAISAMAGTESGSGRGGPAIIAGDGAAEHLAVFAGIRNAEIAAGGFARPSAESLLMLAQQLARRGELAQPHEIRPLYLRRPDAKPAQAPHHQPQASLPKQGSHRS